MQTLATASKVEVSPTSMVAQLVVSHSTKFVEGQNILGIFLRLALPTFSSALSEHAYEFLINCEDRLYDFDLKA